MLLAGSEGTLAVMHRMTVNLVPVMQEKVLVVLSFKSIPAAMDAVPGILESQPSAIELLPRQLIDLAREVPAYAPMIDFYFGTQGRRRDECAIAPLVLAPRCKRIATHVIPLGRGRA